MQTADSDQTERMPRLIGVFARQICHFVGFVMRQLILACVQILQILASYLMMPTKLQL